MQPILAITWLTLKAAFRYRLVLVLVLLMLGVVVGLPLVIKSDGTARGLTQILLTYTLGTIVVLLGFANLWLGCGIMARDIEENQIQMVAVKPVARWQIWLGKWFGLLTLNAALLTFAGLLLYGLILYRAQSLDEEQKAILEHEVLVGRTGVREPIPDYSDQVEKNWQAWRQMDDYSRMGDDQLRQVAAQALELRDTVISPNMRRRWRFDLKSVQDKVEGEFLYIRSRFHAAYRTRRDDFFADWRVGPIESSKIQRSTMNLAPDTYHELPVPPGLLDENGVLWVEFWNSNTNSLVFPLQDGLEVLYRDSGFGGNFFRGIIILFLWLAFLSAIGLFSASYLSFPVAAFVSLSLLVLGLFTGTMEQVVKEGTIAGVNHDDGSFEPTVADHFLIPAFKGILKAVRMITEFSPVDQLSTGRTISWGVILKAWFQIGFMAALLAGAGISLFYRRELATASNHSV